MNEAQIGLLIVSPLLIGMVVLLYCQGVMTRSGAALAALASVGTVAWLFFTQ
ncbi:hypothetical protein [Azospirillum argentinense]|uniref:hypothetical protein n=1 Tax=Azospirillum argentinense TaxID=2970906 RepID=UPI00190983E6|nr:hypothetical protein [Azospirillum argentinense]